MKTYSIKALILVIISGFIMVGCSNEELPNTENPKNPPSQPTDVNKQPATEVTLDLTAAELNAAREVKDFNDTFLRAADAEMFQRDENLVVSPLSAQLMLGILANAGNEAVRQELTQLMGYTSLEAFNSLNSKLMKCLPVLDRETDVTFANSTWYDTALEISPDFATTFTDMFDGAIQKCDIHTKSTVDVINRWCAEKTNNQIPHIIYSIPAEVNAIFANIVHFNGLWDKEYEFTDVSMHPFHAIDGNASEVKMMHKTTRIDYLDAQYAKGIRIPFGNGAFTATFVKPDGMQFDEFVNKFSLKDCEDAWIKDSYCSISLPRCTIKGEQINVSAVLEQQFSLKALFSPEGISAFLPKQQVDGIYQKSAIEFTEKGAKASSVTWTNFVTLDEMFHPQVIEFNSPYLFYITERQTGTCLLAGKIVKL